MQGMIPVKDYTSAAEMRAAFAETRARLMKPKGSKPVETIAASPAPRQHRKTAPANDQITKFVFLEQQDAHVRLWTQYAARRAVEIECEALETAGQMERTLRSLRAHLSRQRTTIEQMRAEAEGPKPKGKTRAVDVINRMARNTGYSVEAILGACRAKQIARVRHLTTYQIHIECPHLSIADIGRVMGGRDRTTVINSIEQAKRVIMKGQGDE